MESMTLERTGHCIFSIGHSNHSLEWFINLLKQHCIQVLADVRSQPHSKYTAHFDRDAIRAVVTAVGVEYIFLGKELGGRPSGDEFYDAEGHVLYGRVAEAPFFRQGIERLEQLLKRARVAMMCAEENPADCHRHLLIAHVLTERGTEIEHIRSDGSVQTEAEVRAGARQDPDAGQLMLFEQPKELAWKSTRSVSPKRAQPSSSQS